MGKAPPPPLYRQGVTGFKGRSLRSSQRCPWPWVYIVSGFSLGTLRMLSVINDRVGGREVLGWLCTAGGGRVPPPPPNQSDHPNQEGDTCIDWTSQYCWTNGWNCLWRGHSVYRNRPLIPPKLTIVGKNDIYHWENLVGPVLVHKLFGPRPPSLPPF